MPRPRRGRCPHRPARSRRRRSAMGSSKNTDWDCCRMQQSRCLPVLLGQRDPNDYRFSAADFRRYGVKALGNKPIIPCGLFLVSTKIRSLKTALHLRARNVRGIFVMRSADGLAPVKRQRAKRPEQSRSQAADVRVSSPLLLLGGDDLAAVIGSALFAGSVRQMQRAALRALHQTGNGQLPVCPSLVSSRLGYFPLRNCHVDTSFLFFQELHQHSQPGVGIGPAVAGAVV